MADDVKKVLDLIKEQKYAQEARKREISMKDAMVTIEQSWNAPAVRDLLPSPNPFATTNQDSWLKTLTAPPDGESS